MKFSFNKAAVPGTVLGTICSLVFWLAMDWRFAAACMTGAILGSIRYHAGKSA